VGPLVGAGKGGAVVGAEEGISEQVPQVTGQLGATLRLVHLISVLLAAAHAQSLSFFPTINVPDTSEQVVVGDDGAAVVGFVGAGVVGVGAGVVGVGAVGVGAVGVVGVKSRFDAQN